MLRNLASRFDQLLIDLWQDDFPVSVNEVVMPLIDMISQPFDVQKCGIDQTFHELWRNDEHKLMSGREITYSPCTCLLVGKCVLATNCILEINRLHWTTNQEEEHDSFSSIFFVKTNGNTGSLS